jgi:hypothetical protein
MADGQNALLKGSNCLGSHLIPAHFGRREFNNVIRRSLCDVLQRFLSEKSLMSRNHERSGEIHRRKNNRTSIVSRSDPKSPVSLRRYERLCH